MAILPNSYAEIRMAVIIFAVLSIVKPDET
jgi:hypothetical protein